MHIFRYIKKTLTSKIPLYTVGNTDRHVKINNTIKIVYSCLPINSLPEIEMIKVNRRPIISTPRPTPKNGDAANLLI